MAEFSHLDAQGGLRMVDVSAKPATSRIAIARCEVLLSPETFELLKIKALPKGDALAAAKVAGILAAKQTAQLIPLCHPLPLTFVDVSFELLPASHSIKVIAEARTTGQTGVEMEALTAASLASLTIYDMCKAVQKDIRIENLRLVHKSGGKSGEYKAS